MRMARACLRLSGAAVAAAIEAQEVAEMRPHLLGPRRAAGALPRCRAWHVGVGEVVDRGIALRRAGAAVAAGAQRARHPAERRDVLGVVPLVEFGFGLRR